MSNRTRRRITYVTLAVTFAAILSSGARNTMFFILGMLTMDLIHMLWKSRNFTNRVLPQARPAASQTQGLT